MKLTDLDPRFYSYGGEGVRDSKTLRPSIQRLGGCRWHGFLTDGQLVAC